MRYFYLREVSLRLFSWPFLPAGIIANWKARRLMLSMNLKIYLKNYSTSTRSGVQLFWTFLFEGVVLRILTFSTKMYWHPQGNFSPIIPTVSIYSDKNKSSYRTRYKKDTSAISCGRAQHAKRLAFRDSNQFVEARICKSRVREWPST